MLLPAAFWLKRFFLYKFHANPAALFKPLEKRFTCRVTVKQPFAENSWRNQPQERKADITCNWKYYQDKLFCIAWKYENLYEQLMNAHSLRLIDDDTHRLSTSRRTFVDKLNPSRSWTQRSTVFGTVEWRVLWRKTIFYARER